MLIGQIAAQIEHAAAAYGAERTNLEPVLIELKHAVELAQAIGQIAEGQCAVLESNTAGQVRTGQRTMCFNLEDAAAAG